MRRVPVCLILLFSFVLSFAQVRPEHEDEVYNPEVLRAKDLVAPCVTLGAGVGIRLLAHTSVDYCIRNWNLKLHEGVYIPPVDDYVQYLPLAMDLGLGMAGAECRHGFWDRTIEAALGYASCGIICNVVKWTFPTMRPNESDTRSFPSGHTCVAFTGAELVRMEYNPGWAAGAYTAATFVGMSRITRDWHWFSDVVAGAAVGILSARIGGWLLEPTKNLLHIKTAPPRKRLNPCGRGVSGSDGVAFSVAPTVDPISGTLCASASVCF